MATGIGSATQLSTFDTFKTVLSSNTVLSSAVDSDSYYEFEPNLKSGSFNGFPYIVVNTPQLDNPEGTFDTLEFKENTVIIELVVEYHARSNYKTYANAVIQALETAESTLETIGLYNTTVVHDGVAEEYMNQKQLVRGTFTVSHDGYVTR